MNPTRLFSSPLRHALTALVLTGAWQPGLLAASSSSASYNITADSVDSGGLHASSAAYANDASAGGVTGTSSVTIFAVKAGYIAQLTGDSPAFTTQPADQTVLVGANVTFTSAATGSPAPTYQWQKGGVNISGATNSSLTLNNVQLGDTGSYRVVATNSEGTATSSTATLTVNAAPAITTQPASQTVTVGASVTFTAAASGTPTPTYQWQKGGVNISGATNASFNIPSAQPGDAATYRVVATNTAGNASSNGAVLTVNAAPAITTQPVGQSLYVGNNVTFTAAASGTPTPTYQWQKNGANILGATSASLALTNIQTGDAAAYRVVATNTLGTATSNAATLYVRIFPSAFDAQGYLSRYPDIAAIYGTDLNGAWLYYRDHGIYNGEVFDDVFRVEEYLSLYPELLSVFGTNFSGALMHWLTQGRIEGRLGRIPLLFSEAGYYAHSLTDPTSPGPLPVAFATNRIMAWEHYWAYGIYEGRAFDDEFLAFHYYAMNPDLQVVFPNDWRGLTLHWLVNGRQEGRLGRVPLIFSSVQYGIRNPDVPPVWGNEPTTLWLHYYYYGVYELRNFDDQFRPAEYLQLNPDLQALFGTDYRAAMMHWVRYGRAEGRPGRIP